MGMPRPGQQPTPEQIQRMQAQITADAQKAGMTVPQFIEHIKKQQMAMRQQAMAQAQAQAQGGQQGQPGQGQPGQGPPQQQRPQQPTQTQQPITPGPPNPIALAMAAFLRGQDLKPRTCILNGERKDMFRGT